MPLLSRAVEGTPHICRCRLTSFNPQSIVKAGRLREILLLLESAIVAIQSTSEPQGTQSPHHRFIDQYYVISAGYPEKATNRLVCL